MNLDKKGLSMLDLTSAGLRLYESATFENCTELLQRGCTLWAKLPREGSIEIECEGLTQIDSSLLAVLLEWQEQAHEQSRALILKNAPANLRHLAKLYGIDSWFEGLAI